MRESYHGEERRLLIEERELLIGAMGDWGETVEIIGESDEMANGIADKIYSRHRRMILIVFSENLDPENNFLLLFL